MASVSKGKQKTTLNLSKFCLNSSKLSSQNQNLRSAPVAPSLPVPGWQRHQSDRNERKRKAAAGAANAGTHPLPAAVQPDSRVQRTVRCKTALLNHLLKNLMCLNTCRSTSWTSASGRMSSSSFASESRTAARWPPGMCRFTTSGASWSRTVAALWSGFCELFA